MGRYRVAIIIPALNEEATISKIVNAVKNYGIVIVIDDGSNDATAKNALKSGAFVLSHKVNQGYDNALNSGFQKANELNCDIAVTVDADGQHNPILIKKFIAKIYEGFDLAIGDRSNKQRIAEIIFGLYTRSRFGILDPLCGLKAYRMSVYNDLGYFDSYKSIGTELTIFTAKNKFSIAQIKIEVIDRSGLSRFGSSIRANFKIIRALFIGMLKY